MLSLAWPWLLLVWPAPALAQRWLRPANPPGAALRWPLFSSIFTSSDDDGPALNKRRWLAWLIWTLLLVAAARPEWIDKPEGTPVSGRSLMMAMDVSASMRSAQLGQEIAMSVVRRTARAFVLGRGGDRVGLILFGTQPYVQAPLTFDLHAVARMADEVVIGSAGEGTALGDALALSVSRLRSLNDATRVLVLLTDGSNTSGIMRVNEAVALARAHNVRVYTIGVGTPNARPGEGLDSQVLHAIAEATGGRYFHASDADALTRVYEDLDELEPLAKTTSHLRVASALYVWPLSLAVLVCAVGLLLIVRPHHRGQHA